VRVGGDVIAILDRCTVDGARLTLPDVQLERRDYVAVNKVIEAAGGKWSRRERAHLFADPAADVIDQIILTGEIATLREAGYFPTPPAVLDVLVPLADLWPDAHVLEPSAGRGAILSRIASQVRTVDCVERDEASAGALRELGLARSVRAADFLTVEPGGEYDRVVMNPPFAKQQDISHVEHALRFLHPGGLLVSVMAAGVTSRLNAKAEGFKKLVADHGGDFIPLPDDAFRESGTGVHTVIAVIPAGSTR
jgi:predicted RNA methylase